MPNKKITVSYNGSVIINDQEVSSSSITYDNTTLVEDFVGTKTLNCSGQVMKSNVIIGEKTLNCNGQIMCSNVQVVSINAAPSARFIAVNNDKSYYSTDLSIWTQMTGLPLDCDFKDITYGNGRFVLIGDKNISGTSYVVVCISTDGKTWTQTVDQTIEGEWLGITFGNGKFIAVGDYGAIYYSTDGISWESASIGEENILTSIAYGNNHFVAVSLGAGAFYSTDGLTWTYAEITDQVYLIDIAFGNDRFICIDSFSRVGYYSVNGSIWTECGQFENYIDPNCICFGDDTFIVGSEDGSVGPNHSTNGESWIEAETWAGFGAKTIAYGNGTFVSSWGEYSEDKGVNWEELESLSELGSFYLISYGGV